MKIKNVLLLTVFFLAVGMYGLATASKIIAPRVTLDPAVVLCRTNLTTCLDACSGKSSAQAKDCRNSCLATFKACRPVKVAVEPVMGQCSKNFGICFAGCHGKPQAKQKGCRDACSATMKACMPAKKTSRASKKVAKVSEGASSQPGEVVINNGTSMDITVRLHCAALAPKQVKLLENETFSIPQGKAIKIPMPDRVFKNCSGVDVQDVDAQGKLLFYSPGNPVWVTLPQKFATNKSDNTNGNVISIKRQSQQPTATK